MPDVTVHPHGNRWAVATSDSSSSVGEFETREAALSSARELAAGGHVEVLADDPSTLIEPHGEPAAEETSQAPVDGLTEPDHPRVEQGGL